MYRPLLLIAVSGLASLASSAHGQVVQLPTFRQFSVNTTVVVPDRGSTYLGGVNRAAYGSSSSGVPGFGGLPGAGRLLTNRGIGSEISSSSAHASATIMDLEALDRSVLAEAAARRGVLSDRGLAADGSSLARTNPEVARKAAFLSKHVAKTDAARRATTAPRLVPQLPRRQ